jgi:hypothetical protein
MDKNLTVSSVNKFYFSKFLTIKNKKNTQVGNLVKVDGFNDYNFLVDINSIFSNYPNFFPIDRTQTVNHPIKWHIGRPWQAITTQLTLEDALKSRVTFLSSLNKKINIFWSGGIDSTTIVNSFLKYNNNHSQIRVIYSPWSLYEHPEYFDFLKKFNTVELINLSGEKYLDLDLDGIFISGNSGDEIHASIDDSFFKEHGFNKLLAPWEDFFIKKNKNNDFLEFCNQFFSKSGLEIKTLLDARWWFYTSTKITSLLREDTLMFLSSTSKTFDPENLIGFFDCYEYEQYIAWNIDKIITNDNYALWKHFLKVFCYKFDACENWYQHKKKCSSIQIRDYANKKNILNNQRTLFILNDGTKITTSSLPFLSSKELNSKYSTELDYLLNDPN